RAAVPPQRRTDGADAGASCPLLFPQFLAGARDQLLVLGSVSAGTLRGAVVPHRLPQQVLVDRAEHLIGEVKRPDLLPAQTINIDSCHMSSVNLGWPTSTSQRPTPVLSFLRRSLGCLQRIHRGRTAKSATLSGRLLGLGNHQVPTVRSGHAAF